ncbi:MAG TPA: ABC transporter permease, partial [Chlamydiales bacterium]|nr:ABC transporter permease [Chlamydiales bacterium]
VTQYQKDLEMEQALRISGANPEKAALLTEKNQRFEELQNRLHYIQDKNLWLAAEKKKIKYMLMPLVRPLHWQDDAGGDQALNLQLPFMELSRLNRQDLLAAILFGARISMFVGLFAVLLELAIGIPLGLISGYFAGRTDIILSRFVEIWESMPAFFMLLLIVSLLQTKSLFLIITVIALFSWTSTFRFVRAESLRQREIPYIEACQAIGFPTPRILFSHILPNAIVPVVALLPFDIMSAITREAGLSFLGLGEELSCSWGQLMEEGASAFPAESALLWPPAIALSLLLIAIAFIGDALMNALNPKTT